VAVAKVGVLFHDVPVESVDDHRFEIATGRETTVRIGRTAESPAQP